MAFLAAATALAGIGTKIWGAHQAGKERKRMSRRASQYEKKLAELDANRQAVINPYANLTNPFQNLGVATGASQFAAEEADISLANTLDYLRDTGASAGGATAIAQSALRAKQGIQNRIEEQEVRNMELAARGQQQREQLIGQGEQFRFNTQEFREADRMNYVRQLGEQSRMLEQGYRQQKMNQIASIGGDLMGVAGGIFAGQSE